MQRKKWITTANIITGSRILISAMLLFNPVFSPGFYVLYLAAGLSDMIDGPVARRTGTVSEFGSRLDSAADFVFVVVCLAKILPAISIPGWLYVWTAIIALIKVINMVSGYVIRKRLVTIHTVMNKITGALLFLLPLTFSFVPLKYSVIVVCAAATFAAIQEGHFIRTGRENPAIANDLTNDINRI